MLRLWKVLESFFKNRRQHGSRLGIFRLTLEIILWVISSLLVTPDVFLPSQLTVFGLHDREKYEINCYSLSQSDGSKWRSQIESGVDAFKDISQMHFGDAVNLIRADRVHILVNLNGYTKGAKNEIFALRPAPVQVGFSPPVSIYHMYRYL